ncbi:MAG TPA: hypothetical protein PKY59_21165 [Pyrinomonadaceae bacterium]|nr:hypothetical protein [Pyrinomonadaceae bacterium]
MHEAKNFVNTSFSFSSSVADDVWHRKESAKSYEWWYFDALSDDGNEAVVITFLDNFVFSPRYNTVAGKQNSQSQTAKIPAVAFNYYRNGKPVYRAVNEFAENDFSASIDQPECHIGDNHLVFRSAPYGSGYLITINAKLSNNRRIEALFEWLDIESDFTPSSSEMNDDSHYWNLVAPRTDVSGRITVYGKDDKELDVRHFRGTGYHDHNIDNRWLPETVKDWHWGRVHFADSTAVFYRFCENCGAEPMTKLLVIRDGVLRERDCFYVEAEHTRDKFGIRYPKRLRFESEDNLKLRVNHLQVIDSSFYYLRFLSEMTLSLRDGKPRKKIGITEYLAPKTLRYRWLDWLVNMRIGRNGKGSFLP